MGKFKEALGILQLDIGGVELELKPKMGDNDKMANIVNGYQKHKDQARLLKDLRTFAYDLIVREDSSLIDEDREELQLALELHQMDLMEQLMVAFRWTTREQLDKAKKMDGDTVKNLMT